jgi:biotin transport system substrate-specific component
MKTLSTRKLCFIALFAAVMAVLSPLAIPLPGGVSLTLQTFIIALSAALLGAKLGALAATVYIMLGAVGAPVFHGFQGGFHMIVGPTGGFILSFPIMAAIIGLAAEKSGKGHLLWPAMGLAVGSAVNLTMGTLQFAFVNGISLQTAFLAAFAPFIPIEAIKMAMVFALAPPIRRLLPSP